jgi:micrococcal nuclease
MCCYDSGNGRPTQTTIMRKIIIYILLLTTFVCFGTTTKVTRVIDGDTFITETGEKVRLIGINAPEISDIFGHEAKQHLANLIDQKRIDLQTDNISNDRDKYSRLLRYVIFDGTDINKKMLLDGFATAYLKYNFRKSEEYRLAQLTALKENVGMWANGNEDEILNKQNNKESDSQPLSSKVYFIGALILILICIGIYFYL